VAAHDDDAPPTEPAPGPAVTDRHARIQKWAIIAFALVEAVIIALVLIVRIRGG
jgi:archaellum biogenesis protein FlaJ (TadC family)